MGNLVLKGATSGQITVTPTAVAGSNTLTLPALTGTVLTNVTPGATLQVITAASTSYASGTTTIPLDDTIPQNTEGTEFLTATITPKSSTSKLIISFNSTVSTSATAFIVTALFQDSTANALAANFGYMATGSGSIVACLTYAMTAGTTSATTFKIRIGPQTAATVAINGTSGARLLGGTATATLTITEIAA